MDEQSSASLDQTETSKGGDVGDANRQSPVQMRRELEEEFNVQRAKMKELYLQKEEDIRKMVQDKEQLDSEVLSLRAELEQLQTLSQNQKSEIESLQLLVSETVEASSSESEAVRRLHKRNLDLEQQLGQMKHQLSQMQQQEVSLAPATLVRTLARKLGADTEVDQPINKRSVEEGELVQSIIQPLELQITALKDKLRDTDAQLQEAIRSKSETRRSPEEASSGLGDSGGDTDGGRSRGCDMCANYEKQLVSEQAQAEAARDKALRLEHTLKLASAELEGVRSVHDETIRAWHGERAHVASQLDELRARTELACAQLEARAAAADAHARDALHHVTTLTVDRETLQKKLDTLERDNATLMGQYLRKAAEMQNEIIDLPSDLEELQEHALRAHEQLVQCAVARERAVAAELDAREHVARHAALLHAREADLAETRSQLREARAELDRLQTEREQMRELGDKLRNSTDMIERLLDDKKRLQAEVQELRSRVGVLQQELDNSEKVQQDFVRLSQSLQVQLQRIREADTEVRWQHDEDVAECPDCHTPLPTSRKKVHCRHCGRIFCAACTSHGVPSGPRGVPARVCSVCRTLLQPDTAPYFSTEPPRTPH